MELSNDLLSQFAKITNDKGNTKSDVTVYGTVKKVDNSTYVQLDGSDRLTPVSITVEVKDKERVTVALNNHTATVTGNMSSPAARIDTVNDGFTAINSNIKVMNSNISVMQSNISVMQSNVSVMQSNISIYNSSFQITNGVVTGIKGIDTDWITTKDLAADHATIEKLDTKYANVDFANIGDVAMKNFYANSGLIKDVTVKDGTITGELLGVTIKGDLIEANTLVAKKLVIEGVNGLYYRLNTDGVKVEAQQTDYNSLNGSVIVAKSVTASKINVSDLVAFDATIGGFKITEDSIYSGVKESINNTTRGIYLDNTGQIAFGDSTSYLKYYKTSDGSYKLTIASESIDNAAKTATNYLNFSSNGLVIGDCTGDTLGANVLIDSDSVDIRNGETVYASYGADRIYLGKNSQDTIIDLCSGVGQMQAWVDGGLNIESDMIVLTINNNTSDALIGLGGKHCDIAAGNEGIHLRDTDEFIDVNVKPGISLWSERGIYLQAQNWVNENNGVESFFDVNNDGTIVIKAEKNTNTDFYEVSFGLDVNNSQILMKATTISAQGNLYSPNGVITSSDIRLKENISTDMSKYIAMLDLLEPISYTWIAESDDPNKKTHISYGAQYVHEAMSKVGIDDFAGLHKNIQDDTYGLCLENFIPILHAKIKQLENRIKQLESQ